MMYLFGNFDHDFVMFCNSSNFDNFLGHLHVLVNYIFFFFLNKSWLRKIYICLLVQLTCQRHHRNHHLWFAVPFKARQRVLREGCKKNQNVNFFQICLTNPIPPSKCKLFEKKFKKKLLCPKTSSVALRTYRNTFMCKKNSF